MALPVLSTYFMMASVMDISWTINVFVSLTVLMLLVEWRAFISLAISGILTGIALFAFTKPYPIDIIFDKDMLWMLSYAAVYSLALGALFARQIAKMDANKQKESLAFAGAIAHDLRTPINSILNFNGNL